MKRTGLQWLHRLLQDPARLWKRYLRNNPVFVWRIALQFLKLRNYGGRSACSPEAATSTSTTNS
jgi:hypothetical protein